MSKFQTFAGLHKSGEPLILFNAWDPGSARAVAAAGAPAIATGSWGVAAANGYEDGERLPLDLALSIAERIVRAVDLPVTIDFEGGYAPHPDGVGTNSEKLAATGAVGCNFEDRLIAGDGLYPLKDQAERIAAMRQGAGASFFINARTDVFLKTEVHEHGAGIGQALERAHAYAEAGASGFFVPGLSDPDLIGRICEESPLPVNIIVFPGVPDADELGRLGVARISHGAGPYRAAMARLREDAAVHYRR